MQGDARGKKEDIDLSLQNWGHAANIQLWPEEVVSQDPLHFFDYARMRKALTHSCPIL